MPGWYPIPEVTGKWYHGNLTPPGSSTIWICYVYGRVPVEGCPAARLEARLRSPAISYGRSSMPNRRAEANQELSVLVVDDEETIVEFLQMGLQYEGFTVEVANDGETALEIYRKTRPDLVILDWMLPGKDGLEVCRRIRAMGDTPVIMLTAKG